MLLLAIGGAAGAGGAWTVRERLYAPFPEARSEEVFFEVRPGEPAARIARRLEKERVIDSDFWFRLYLRLQGEDFHLKAGEYRFDEPESAIDVAHKLHEGEVYHHKVTVPEGRDRWEVARIWEEAGFGGHGEFFQLFASPEPIRELDPLAADLEGYLFPETYLLPRGTRPERIVRLMVQGFTKIWNEERRRRAERLGLTPRQVVTLASLIEEETGHPEERRLISAVFHNRLRMNMKLECDPTVIYAVKRVKPWDGIIHRSDLQFDSPYNTYLYPGLPPGPISNPGLASIDAALDPAQSEYLFFVSRNDGSHVFSETYREHARAVREFQR